MHLYTYLYLQSTINFLIPVITMLSYVRTFMLVFMSLNVRKRKNLEEYNFENNNRLKLSMQLFWQSQYSSNCRQL